jgi:prefoldin subunit 5
MADTTIDIKKEEVEVPEAEVAEVEIPDMSLLDITDGENERKIPAAKFIDDIGQFSASFKPPASAELLIGAYSELHNKYKTFEATLTRKRKYPTLVHCMETFIFLAYFSQQLAFKPIEQHLKVKVPDLEKSLTLIKELLNKKEEGESGTVRYSLADNIYAKAELDYEGTVNLWLGANVMLEYTYEEAIDFLSKNEERARSEYEDVEQDLAFVRDQIVTCEVLRSRIYNWDVRKRRNASREEKSSS